MAVPSDPALRPPRRVPALRRSVGDYDELERMAMFGASHRVEQRRRTVLGLLLLLVITLTIGLVCVRGARLATPIDPEHVLVPR